MAVRLVQEVAVKVLSLNMNRIVSYIVFLISISGFSQESLNDVLNRFNTKSVPYISVEELTMPKTEAIILDAREKIEYDVSHIKGAIYVGYDNFNIRTVENKIRNKKEEIVVYCSLGIRSEDIAEKLKKAGYSNVKNLYGGIFEWKNKDLSLYNNNNVETDTVHVYNRRWGKWLIKGVKVL